MSKGSLYAISFSTNAVILIFEITGGRLLAPYLGTAVGVWAGLISVVLGGMALGYHWGGKIADAGASKEKIGRLLFASGLAALIAWSVRDIVPTFFAFTEIPETWGALLVGVVLFMPTVLILAAVSPLLVRNLITSVESSGSASGTLYAVGSLGSILGAVATGAFLLPYVGVSSILLGISVFLLFLGFLYLKKKLYAHVLIAAITILLAFFLNSLPTRASVAEADISTEYNRVFIDRSEKTNIRSLSMDPFGTQCGMLLKNEIPVEDVLVFPYAAAFEILRENIFTEAPSRALFLGGCNYSYPRYFLNLFPTAIADVVEIDRGMTGIAETYFNFDEKRFPTLSLFYQDARVFLKQTPQKYDVIFMDTFGSSKGIPVHLTTKEMFRDIKNSLSDEGYLFINAHGAYAGEQVRFPSALYATIRESFPSVSVYHLNNEPTEFQNLIFVASQSVQLPEMLTSQRFPDVVMIKVAFPDDGRILTDDFAPVERLMN